MPTPVSALLQAAGLQPHSCTGWGIPPTLDQPGVYLVTNTASGLTEHPPPAYEPSEARLLELLRARPELTVHGRRPTVKALSAALRAMWVDGETVLYIGLASRSVRSRVTQYYGTPLGARSPHAGGWPIKTLAGLASLHVHVSPSEDPEGAERAMLDAFMAGVPAPVRAALSDPDLPLPFANLQFGQGIRKRHGIYGARALRVHPQQPQPMSPIADALEPVSPTTAPRGRLSGSSAAQSFALNVTATDLSAGRIRITREAKHVLQLPVVITTVTIDLRGVQLRVAWDPKLGPDKERSGILRVPASQLRHLLGGPTMLRIGRDAAGLLTLG